MRFCSMVLFSKQWRTFANLQSTVVKSPSLVKPTERMLLQCRLILQITFFCLSSYLIDFIAMHWEINDEKAEFVQKAESA